MVRPNIFVACVVAFTPPRASSCKGRNWPEPSSCGAPRPTPSAADGGGECWGVSRGGGAVWEAMATNRGHAAGRASAVKRQAVAQRRSGSGTRSSAGGRRHCVAPAAPRSKVREARWDGVSVVALGVAVGALREEEGNLASQEQQGRREQQSRHIDARDRLDQVHRRVRRRLAAAQEGQQTDEEQTLGRETGVEQSDHRDIGGCSTRRPEPPRHEEADGRGDERGRQIEENTQRDGEGRTAENAHLAEAPYFVSVNAKRRRLIERLATTEGRQSTGASLERALGADELRRRTPVACGTGGHVPQNGGVVERLTKRRKMSAYAGSAAERVQLFRDGRTAGTEVQYA